VTDEQAEELNDLAETIATYLKALYKRGVPLEVAGPLVCEWQRAYIQDEIDRRARGRRASPPFQMVYREPEKEPTE
jgi:hypothetical protein